MNCFKSNYSEYKQRDIQTKRDIDIKGYVHQKLVKENASDKL